MDHQAPPDEGEDRDSRGQERPQNPWDRGPRETDHDWAYFSVYLKQGWPNGVLGDFTPRNMSQLARELGVDRSTLAQRSMSFHWTYRCGEYDRHVEESKAKASRTAIARSQDRWLRIVSKARTLGERELEKYLARSSDPSVPALTAKEALAVLDWARTVERQYLTPDSPDKPLDPDAAVDLEKLELEDLEKLHSVLVKARGTQAGDSGPH